MVPVLKSRGYTVAIIKEMKGTTEIAISEAVKDTRKYKEAGEKIVAASPQSEITFSMKQKISLNEISPFLQNVDYIFLEGFENEKILPKIITGRTANEVLSFSDGLAIAISGTIAEEHDEAKKNICS